MLFLPGARRLQALERRLQTQCRHQAMHLEWVEWVLALLPDLLGFLCGIVLVCLSHLYSYVDLCWSMLHCLYLSLFQSYFWLVLAALARHPLAWAAVAAGHFRQPDRLSLLDEHQHLCKLFWMPLLKYVEFVQHIAAWKDTKNPTTLSNNIFEHHWSIGSAAPQATKNTKTGARFSRMRPAFDEGRLRPGSKLRKGMGKEWSCRGNMGKAHLSRAHSTW